MRLPAANPRASLDAAIVSCLDFRDHRRRAGEPKR
jgi:hypothetical protein